MDAFTLTQILVRGKDRAELEQLAGSLYDAASKTFDHLHDAPQEYHRNEPARIAAYRAEWTELRDLAQYVDGIAGTMKTLETPCRANLYCECDACNALDRDHEQRERAASGWIGDNHAGAPSPMFEA